MKVIHFIICAMLIRSAAIAEQETAPSNLEKLSPEQAEQLVNSNTTKVRQDMAAAAVRSKRLNLIRMCIENQFTRRKLARPLMEQEDEDFRDEVVVMILRNETGFWTEDSARHTGGLGSVNMMNEPIIAAIRRNLPDFPLEGATIDENPVSTRADRLKLAGKIETAIGIRKGTLSAPTLERPEKRSAPVGNSPDKSSSRSSPTTDGTSQKVRHEKSWLEVCISGALAGMAGYGMLHLFQRVRRRDGRP